MSEISSEKIVKNIAFKFKNQNLSLWPANPEHAKDLLTALHESLDELKKFLPWSHESANLMLNEQIKRLAKAQYDFYLGSEFIFHLYSEDKKLLGSFGLHRRTLNPRGLELGYWVRKNAMGQGYATEASKALIVYAFEILECERLQCGYNENNLASQKVNQKISFIKEGILARFEPLHSQSPQMGIGMVLGRLLKDEAQTLSWYEAMKNACKFNFTFKP